MDGLQALALLKRHIDDQIATQADLARDIGVSEATVSRWSEADRPMRGSSLKALVDWAERVQAEQGPPPDALTAALLATGENVKRLAEVRGYAQFVLDQLVDLAGRQRQVVDALAPWAEAEGRQVALQMQKAAAAEAALRRAVPPIDQAGALPADPPAKKTASGGQ